VAARTLPCIPQEAASHHFCSASSLRVTSCGAEIMATTAVSVVQAVWDCRWARLAYPINRQTDQWVCVREGSRILVNPQQCEGCPHWEMKDAVDSGRTAS
jgi:hypothetical protein